MLITKNNPVSHETQQLQIMFVATGKLCSVATIPLKSLCMSSCGSQVSVSMISTSFCCDAILIL